MRKFLLAYGDRGLAEAAADRDGIDQALRSFVNTPSTYTRYRNRIRAAFQLAKDDDLITEVPDLRKWTAKRLPPYRWASPEEFVILLRELADHQRPMVLFAAHTGMRQSNVLGLEWSRVDMRRRLAWVFAIDTKANKTISVPLNDVAMSVLEGQQGKHQRYVFVYQGRPISETKTSFLKACVRAGLGQFTDTANPDNKRGFTRQYTGLRWHDLRHTFASWHAMSGTPLQVVKELGGWSSMQMVERYAHLTQSHLAGFANNITEKKDGS